MTPRAATANLAGNAGQVQKSGTVADGSKTFGLVVRDYLLNAGITTGMGNPNWSEFAAKIPGLHYESLRKAVTGERTPAPALMERVAEALGIEPTEFIEYQAWQAQRMFDPREVGLEQVEENLRLFAQARSKKKRR